MKYTFMLAVTDLLSVEHYLYRIKWLAKEWNTWVADAVDCHYKTPELGKEEQRET